MAGKKVQPQKTEDVTKAIKKSFGIVDVTEPKIVSKKQTSKAIRTLAEEDIFSPSPSPPPPYSERVF